MKRILTIIATAMLMGFVAQATNRALIVAINKYQDKSWSDIHASNDARILKKALESHGFNNNITVLADEKATHDAIVNAINTLIKQCKKDPGGVVYLHFSTHGQQMDDIAGIERDALCETIIPYDAFQKPSDSDHGEKHLADFELVPLLEKLRAAIGTKGQLLLVVDACHSDGIDSKRAGDGPSKRGSDTPFSRGSAGQKFNNGTKDKGSSTGNYRKQSAYLGIKAAQAADQCSEIKDPLKRRNLNSRDIYGKLSYYTCLAINKQAPGKFDINEIEATLSGLKIDSIHTKKENAR